MLSLRSKIELTAGVLILAAIAVIAGSWIAAKRDAAKLKTTLAAQTAVIADAAKREANRAKALADSLAAIEDLKKKTTAPAAVVKNLPAFLPLPVPITIEKAAPGMTAAEIQSLPAVLPAADLPALFAFAANCKECDEKLAAAMADRADDAVKLKAMTKERDDAVTAFKGGSKWTRIKKAAKWLAIGVAMGAGAVAVLKK